jgi:hypothetical protein
VWHSITHQTNVDVLDNLDAPPSKRIKTASETEKDVGKGTGDAPGPKTKYKNSDLPPGCLDNNAWRGIFIPTVAHAAGGDNIHPWIIEDDVLIGILTETWKVVYAGKPALTNTYIAPGSPVYHVVSLINPSYPLLMGIHLSSPSSA